MVLVEKEERSGRLTTAVLSIVIPARNEERYIGELLARIRRVDLSTVGFSKEVIVVDDHSADRTADIAASFPEVRLRWLPRHGGKGTAVRAGLQIATGDYLIIQDADLEYDPQDYLPMIQALAAQGECAVYGSRYLTEGRRPRQSWLAYLGGRSLSLLVSISTGRRLTDTSTALKLFRRAFLESLDLTATGFEIDQEVTVKALARRCRIIEVPVRYAPRTRAEGKKIRPRDWLIGALTVLRVRHG
jgi:dolichol-phosphate mannosyltransferase